MDIKSAVLIPSTGILARPIENFLPDKFPFASLSQLECKKTNG